jgi:ABC-type multidrug transport system fused ATPase/permease subunit
VVDFFVAFFVVAFVVAFFVTLATFLVAFLVGLPAVFVARAILGTPMGLKMRRLSSAMLYRKGLL